MDKTQAMEQVERTMHLVRTITYEVPPGEDVAHIGMVGWSLLANPPKDTETAVMLLRFIYQLGREQGRREIEE